MISNPSITIDSRAVMLEGEKNLLEVIRKAGIDMPTFCYHSELSVYGACRLCIVDIEGRGIVGACSTPPAPGMVVRTNTSELREIRKISIELLLSNHEHSCPTCPKNSACQLQSLARRLGVDEVRFKPTLKDIPVDRSAPSIVRDPNKCVLCGDCVRMCHEIQGVGAIDFSHRGANVIVQPAFGKGLDDVECVHCGQCAAVCPTGAITPKFEVDPVWKAIEDPKKKVVAQIAPAVRVAIGEMFGMAAGANVIGQLAAALRMIGFDAVYDTSFAADMTVMEEAEEFLRRVEKGGPFPHFTSCCPAWVKFAEHNFPKLLDNLSTCRSPQQMFGSVAKEALPAELGVDRKDLVVVSFMPCTAKKFEARRPEFAVDGTPDVDYVLSTQELALMIEQAGLSFAHLEPTSLDLPMGFNTGAGVLFGASGGVSEAVLRYVARKLGVADNKQAEFQMVRGSKSMRTAEIVIGDHKVRLAMVYGLANARKLAQQAMEGNCPFDLIEVMACPGGCVGGAGQPCTVRKDIRTKRAKGLHDADRALQLHTSQDNHLLADCYAKHIGGVGCDKAHKMLHTHYCDRSNDQCG